VAVRILCGHLGCTITGKREALTTGLWTAAFAMTVGALVVPLDAALNSITGLDNLSQLISYPALVISSYLIARMTYDVAGIDSRWPIFYTAISIAGMIALADHIGTHTLRWSLSFLYPLVWVIWLISFGALSLAGVIGAYRTKQDYLQLGATTA
jgi:hypothetical protein